MRLCHAFRHQTAFHANEIVRNVFAGLAVFTNALLNERVAMTWIVLRLVHLTDEFGEFSDRIASHLLRHLLSVSRFHSNFQGVEVPERVVAIARTKRSEKQRYIKNLCCELDFSQMLTFAS